MGNVYVTKNERPPSFKTSFANKGSINCKVKERKSHCKP